MAATPTNPKHARARTRRLRRPGRRGPAPSIMARSCSVGMARRAARSTALKRPPRRPRAASRLRSSLRRKWPLRAARAITYSMPLATLYSSPTSRGWPFRPRTGVSGEMPRVRVGSSGWMPALLGGGTSARAPSVARDGNPQETWLRAVPPRTIPNAAARRTRAPRRAGMRGATSSIIRSSWSWGVAVRTASSVGVSSCAISVRADARSASSRRRKLRSVAARRRARSMPSGKGGASTSLGGRPPTMVRRVARRGDGEDFNGRSLFMSLPSIPAHLQVRATSLRSVVPRRVAGPFLRQAPMRRVLRR
jgi:hypothetical protein